MRGRTAEFAITTEENYCFSRVECRQKISTIYFAALGVINGVFVTNSLGYGNTKKNREKMFFLIIFSRMK